MNSSSQSPYSCCDGLPPSAIRRVAAASQALSLGRVDDAEQRLTGLLAAHAEHPEVIRIHAGVRSLRGDNHAAMALMERAVALRPNEASYWSCLGSVLIEASHYDDAITALRRACELDPENSAAWYNLGLALIRCMRPQEAGVALRRAMSHPSDIAIHARVILGEMLRAEGRLDEAVAEYRATIDAREHAGAAWWGLADIKSRRFGDDDLERLRKAMQHPEASQTDLSAMGFALAKALDDRGRFAESLAALEMAHDRVRKPWDASGYSAHVQSILQAFTPAPTGAAGSLGHQAIFIVSLPRSGSTLVEQIFASHSLVHGRGETADLPGVLTQESKRLNQSFPQFVRALSPSDWERMGRRYLQRAAGWRHEGERFTDKLPSNWHYVGVIRAMLPGARIVVVRRDPLETCLACYRQQLANSDYVHTFADLAVAWRNFARATKQWKWLHPAHVHEIDYEALVADPHNQVRELLDFCDLPFEQACLEFHKSERSVHTPSATQVREPLRRDTARARRYGAALDPLRVALGLPRYLNGASDSE